MFRGVVCRYSLICKLTNSRHIYIYEVQCDRDYYYHHYYLCVYRYMMRTFGIY